MTISNRPGAPCFESDYDAGRIDEILRPLDGYIVAQARKKVPRHITSPDVLDLEIDELAQNTRIKLWNALQKRNIMYIKAYIRCVVYSESIDMIRNYKPDLTLSLDEEGEPYQGNVLVAPGEGMRDSLSELKQKEQVAEYITQAVDLLHTLPPCQWRIMICSLKDQLDDVLTLAQASKNFEINIEAVRWLPKKKEAQNLRASLSVTRKKLCIFKEHNVRGSPDIVTKVA